MISFLDLAFLEPSFLRKSVPAAHQFLPKILRCVTKKMSVFAKPPWLTPRALGAGGVQVEILLFLTADYRSASVTTEGLARE